MPSLSAALITRYTTEVDIDWRVVFDLYHPNSGHKYIIDYTQPFQVYTEGGVLTWFQPVPTRFVRPNRDSSGRQEAGLVWGALGDEARDFLDSAIADGGGMTPITIKINYVLLTGPEPQLTPWWEFNLTNVQRTRETVSATATRSDILNRSFPTEVYRIDKYPGLRRR